MCLQNRLTAAALAACLLLAGCARQQPPASSGASPASAGSSQPAASSSQPASGAGTSAAQPAPALVVQIGQQAWEIPAGVSEQELEVTDPAALPQVAADSPLVALQLEGETVFQGSSQELAAFQPAQNGLYRCLARVGETSYDFPLRYALPPQVWLETSSAPIGDVLTLHARYVDGLELTVESGLNFSPRFFPDGDRLTALLPIRYTTAPGEYPLTVRAGEQVFTLPFTAADREFEVQHLVVDQSTVEDTAGSAAANAEWNQLIEPLKPESDPQRYWEGPFLMPAQGPITTEFGCIRYTNNDPTPSRHGGIDIAAGEDDPVYATAAGRVQFAGFLQLTGYTVVLEHGLGLKSWYYHMNGLNVAAGDRVEQGQQIGRVGSTGFSTGPHLHFALSVNQVFVNPWTPMEGEAG